MEGHPEEDYYCEDEQKGHQSVLGLLRAEFCHWGSIGLGLLGIYVSVLEPLAAAEVDGY